MIKEKILKLLNLRVPNSNLENNRVHRFLQRHFEYKNKFFRYLDQNRFMNIDSKICAD